MKMWAGLDMDNETIGACVSELGDEQIRVGDHQMNMERQGGDGFQPFDDRWPNSQVRYEMAVHHIDMQ